MGNPARQSKTWDYSLIMKAIGYVRVSTKQHQTSGLSLEHQERMIRTFCKTHDIDLIDVFSEQQSASIDDREVLSTVLMKAKESGAYVIVSDLCRLSRSVNYIATLMTKGVPFVVCALGLNADAFTIQLFAALAERQRKYISDRTKRALEQKKIRDPEWVAGRKDWKKDIHKMWKANIDKADAFALSLAPLLEELEDYGITTLSAKAKALNARGIRTATGKRWYPTTVKNIQTRLETTE